LLRRGRLVKTALAPTSFTMDVARRMSARRWGMELVKGNAKQGMQVRAVRPQSPAGDIGIAAGDILFNINGMELENEKSFVRAMSKVFMDNGVMLVIGRKGRIFHVPLRL